MPLVGSQIGEERDDWLTRRCALWPSAQTGGCPCLCTRRKWGAPAALAAGVGGELGGDVECSRDRELQSDAAFGAVVTPVWVPAPRSPAHGGLASGPQQAEQVRAPRTAARAAADCQPRSWSGDGGESGLKFPEPSLDSPNPCSSCLSLCWGTLGFDRADGGGSVSRGKCRDWDVPSSLTLITDRTRPLRFLLVSVEGTRRHGGVCRENGGP